MSIQHELLPDGKLHEPKGIVAASANTAYVANGAGTGTWQKIGSDAIKGLSGDGGVVGKRIISDGTNGFSMVTDSAYGVMGISNNGNNFAVTAAVDPTLVSTADYVLFTGTGAPWIFETANAVTFDTNRLIAPVAGVYNFKAWGNVSSYPSNTALVGFRFKINNTTFSPRTALIKSTAAGDYGNVSAFGMITLAANDYVQLFVASSATGNLIVQSFNCTLELRKAS